MTAIQTGNAVYPHFPFDVIKITGNESSDFFQRISTNDFSTFKESNIQQTLLITEKGRIIDAVWVIHCGSYLLLLCSKGMAAEIIAWLNKFIIMEDILLEDISSWNSVDIYFENSGSKTFFNLTANFVINKGLISGFQEITPEQFEYFRILSGIPKIKHELTIDFNPLELNLWNFISFTKGCYIGQEVIARLDTYRKIQRNLCRVKTISNVDENSILIDDQNIECGKITSLFRSQDENTIGLAIIRNKNLAPQTQFRIKGSALLATVDHIFAQEIHGRN